MHKLTQTLYSAPCRHQIASHPRQLEVRRASLAPQLAHTNELLTFPMYPPMYSLQRHRPHPRTSWAPALGPELASAPRADVAKVISTGSWSLRSLRFASSANAARRGAGLGAGRQRRTSRAAKRAVLGARIEEVSEASVRPRFLFLVQLVRRRARRFGPSADSSPATVYTYPSMGKSSPRRSRRRARSGPPCRCGAPAPAHRSLAGRLAGLR